MICHMGESVCVIHLEQDKEIVKCCPDITKLSIVTMHHTVLCCWGHGPKCLFWQHCNRVCPYLANMQT